MTGNRIGKSVTSQSKTESTSYLWDINYGLPQVLTESDAKGTALYSYGLGRISMADPRRGQMYYQYDGLGSSSEDKRHELLQKTYRYYYNAFLRTIFMDYGEIISDSIDYSKNALVGNWKTWLAFIICGLPFALIGLLFDPEKMQTADYWINFPWGQLFALLLAGFLLSFLTEGYVVRVLRGITPPPEFDNWVSLYLDGIKVLIVQIIWFIPVVVVFCITVFFFAFADAIKESALALPMRIGVLLLIVVAIVLTILILLCISFAAVRYARTGSIREGIRYSAVIETIRAIGWGSYILALIVLLVTAIMFFIVVSIFAIIPFIGWVLNLALGPLFSVFAARYLSRIYDQATPPAPLVSGPAAGV